MAGHRLNLAFADPQFASNLAVRQVQTHEIQAQDPDPQGLVMARQNRPGQIVEALAAAVTQIALAVPLGLVSTVAHNLWPAAPGTLNPLRPAVLADQLKALGIIDQERQVDQVGHGSRKSQETTVRSRQPARRATSSHRPSRDSSVGPGSPLASPKNRERALN
jgi:hypothetical protein